LVPFVYALFNNGNILNGIIATIGVVILHLGTNLFDDVIDYIREKKTY
jgi:1,4-dihydroxy-2-naphthoate octaprenyltransferase